MKRTSTAYLLWLLGLFGLLGLHRFYLGRHWTGLLWLLTGGLCGIGALIDLLIIPSMVQIEVLSRNLLLESQAGEGPTAASTPATA